MHLAEAGRFKPGEQFCFRVVILVLRSEPVERVTNTIFAVRVGAEIDDLIQDLIDDGDPTQPASPLTPSFQFFWRHPCCPAAQALIERLLPPLIATIQPDRITSSRFHQFSNRIKNGPSVGVMMHHSDRKDEIERGWFEWQSFQVGLKKGDE